MAEHDTEKSSVFSHMFWQVPVDERAARSGMVPDELLVACVYLILALAYNSTYPYESLGHFGFAGNLIEEGMDLIVRSLATKPLLENLSALPF